VSVRISVRELDERGFETMKPAHFDWPCLWLAELTKILLK